jgi:hypothetical protein
LAIDGIVAWLRVYVALVAMHYAWSYERVAWLLKQ